MLWPFSKQDTKNSVQRTPKNKAAIIGLFVFGIVFMLSIATTSFRELLGIPKFNLNFNSSVPTLIMIYAAMIFYLNYVVPKFKIEKKKLDMKACFTLDYCASVSLYSF